MTATAVVGANWGDEGKGKMVDYLAARADVVVRFQGGNNAGHTIINEFGRFVVHMLPSGIFYPHVVNVIGPGVALNLSATANELAALASQGLSIPQLKISERAQVVLPYHRLLDVYEEERLGARHFGSTRQGIAPFYADKYLKVGVQVADLVTPARLAERIAQALATKNTLFTHLYGHPALTTEKIVESLLADSAAIMPFVTDTTTYLHEATRAGKQILLEGQLGALRDPDHGIYPYPTSSSPLAGFATVGAGIPPRAITQVIAVTKAYSSCVGAGPFVTELAGTSAEELRRRGGDRGEYGATTGRPRRVGWFDAVATRYGCMVQGATGVALTNLDVLSYLGEIPVCVAYAVDGQRIQSFPTTARLEQATPLLTSLPGWSTDITRVRCYADLPANARQYVETIEAMIETPIQYISVGPERQALIVR